MKRKFEAMILCTERKKGLNSLSKCLLIETVLRFKVLETEGMFYHWVQVSDERLIWDNRGVDGLTGVIVDRRSLE